ncbi:CPBP family glutamic-type intramembrane protease [Paenibacillus thiaminolyticus]|uniref:CPBP family glutamic-type intramembrane protease n=1 Tax=Paenibacillus thiaminolyticus TaxID=49283 RepID=UPI0034DDA945
MEGQESVHGYSIFFFRTGLVFGFLWLRTNNLIAPVFVHSIIDAISGYQAIVSKYPFW